MTTQWKETSSRYNRNYVSTNIQNIDIFDANTINSNSLFTTTVSCEDIISNTTIFDSLDISNIDIKKNVITENISVSDTFDSSIVSSETFNADKYVMENTYCGRIRYETLITVNPYTFEDISTNSLKTQTMIATDSIYSGSDFINDNTQLNIEFSRNNVQNKRLDNMFNNVRQINDKNHIQDINLTTVDGSLNQINDKNVSNQDIAIVQVGNRLNQQIELDNNQDILINVFLSGITSASNETITLPSQTVLSPVIPVTIVDGSFNTNNFTLTLDNGMSNNFIKTIDLSRVEKPVIKKTNSLTSGLTLFCRTIAIDSSDNVYAGGVFGSVNYIANWDPVTSTWSSLGGGLNDTCNAIAIDSQDNVYAGGNFSSPGERVARWNPFTKTWSSLGEGLKRTFGSSCSTIAIDSQDNVYVGGIFTEAGDISANSIAKWDPVTSTWSSLGDGLTRAVFTIAVVQTIAIDSQDNVYVGGVFTNAGDISANNIAKWDPVTSMWSSLGNGLNNTCNAIAIDSQDNVYAGGDFTSPGIFVSKWDPSVSIWHIINGYGSRCNTLAIDDQDNIYAGGRYLDDSIGKFDGSSWSSLDIEFNGNIQIIKFDKQENMYVGGEFNSPGKYIIRYGVPYIYLSANLIENNNNIFVRLLDLNNPLLYLKWNTRWTIINDDYFEWVTDGENNNTQDNNIDSIETSIININEKNVIQDISINSLFSQIQSQDINLKIVDGSLNQINDKNRVQDIAIDQVGNRLNQQMELDNNQNVSIQQLNNDHISLSNRNDVQDNNIDSIETSIININEKNDVQHDIIINSLPSQINQITNKSDSQDINLRIVDGSLNQINDKNRVQDIAINELNTRLNQQMELDSNQNVVIDSFLNGLTTISNETITIPSQTIISPTIPITNIGGSLLDNATINLVNGTKDNFMKTIDLTRVRANVGISQMINGFNGFCYSIAIDNNNNIYAGGSFTTAGGKNISSIAKWDGVSWYDIGSGLNGACYSIAIDSNNHVYAGGNFTRAGGKLVYGIAKWNGVSWSSLGNGFGLYGICFTIAIDRSDVIYAGGDFLNAVNINKITGRETALQVRNIARWSGSSWSSLGDGLNRICNTIVLSKDTGLIYAGGRFESSGTKRLNRIGVWNGISWSSLGSGLEDDCFSIAFDNGGNLYAGGRIISIWNGLGWSTLGVPVDNVIRTIGLDNNDNVYVGGFFTTPGNRIFRYGIPYIYLYSNIRENSTDLTRRLINSRLKLKWVSSLSRWVVLGDESFIENGDSSIYTLKNVGINTKDPELIIRGIDINGTIRYNSIVSTSDNRLKKNIIPLKDVFNKVTQMRGVSFNFINQHGRENGFIAQEVEDVYPELVNIGNDGIKSVKYSNINAILVEALKELNDLSISVEKKRDLIKRYISS